MHNPKNKFLTLTVFILIAIFMIPIMCFALGNSKGINTAWSVTPFVSTASESSYPDSVILKIDSSVKSAYAYIGNVYNAPDNKIKFTLDSSDSESSIKQQGDYFAPNRKEIILEINPDEYLGWVELPLSSEINSTYVKLGTQQSFELFEIAFFDKDGNIVPATCYGGIVWHNGKHVFLSAKEDNGTFTRVADEQKAIFAKKGVNSLSASEIKIAGAVNNFINFKSNYVSDTAGPLGVELISIGVLLFGSGAFGLRIIPFLFYVATLYLIYHFVNKNFGSYKYALIAIIIYTIAGLGLSLALTANVVSISLFFTILSLDFALDFSKKAVDAKGIRKYYGKIVLCGLFFALSLSVSIFSLFVLPVLLILCLVPAIKGIISLYGVYKNAQGLEKEYAREKYRKTLFVVASSVLASFVIIPFAVMLATYGIAFATYGKYYDANVFAVITKNHTQILGSQSKGLFLSWIIGLGGEGNLNSFGVHRVVVANRALTILCTVSVIILAVLFILNKKNKLFEGKLIVALNESRTFYIAIALTFVCGWLFNAIFWGNSSYANFALSSFAGVISLTLLHKILTTCIKKDLLRILTFAFATVIVAFFILQLPLIFNFDLPEKLQVIYEWLI